MANINKEFLNIKNQLESIELELTEKINQFDNKNDNIEMSLLDKQEYLPKIIKLFIGGNLYSTLTSNLLCFKESLFALIISKFKIEEIEKGIYIERSSLYFEYILNFMKHKCIDLSSLDFKTLSLLREEAAYYILDELCDYIDNNYKEPVLIGYSSALGHYRVDNQIVGSDNLESLSNIDPSDGMTFMSVANVTFELQKSYLISVIDFMPFQNNQFGVSNSYGALVYVGNEIENLKEVGVVPSVDQLSTIKCYQPTEGKYIRFVSTGYFGISHLKIS